LRLGVLCSRSSPGQCRLTLLEPDALAEPKGGGGGGGGVGGGGGGGGWPRPGLSSIAASARAPALLRRPYVVLSLGPNVRRLRAGVKEVSYYHRVTPAGLIPCRRTPVLRGFAFRDGRPRLGAGHSRRRGPLFPERACGSPVAVPGPGSGSPTRSAGVAWTLIVYAGKGV